MDILTTSEKLSLSFLEVWLKAIVLFLMSFFCHPVKADTVTLVDWCSEASQKRLSSSEIKADFFALTPHFEGQINKVFCGVTSLTIVANALRVAPQNNFLPLNKSNLKASAKAYFPTPDWNPFFHRYAQKNILDAAGFSDQALFGHPSEGRQSGRFGLSLDELTDIAERLKLVANRYTVSLQDIEQNGRYEALKKTFIDTLATPKHYVISNYYRKSLGQEGGGHFSPVVAYDKDSDSFLIMDVSNTFETWVWVDARDIFNAMATRDGNSFRGFLTVTIQKEYCQASH